MENPDRITRVLLIGVDNFFAFDVRFRLIAIAIITGFLLTMSCLIDQSWSHSDTTRFGFWDHCFLEKPFICCESFEEFLGRKPGWLKTTIAFTIIAFIFSFVSVVLVISSMCVSNLKMRKRLMMHIITPVCCLVTAVMLLISVSIISNTHQGEQWSKQNRISRTFVIAILGLVLFGGSFILLLCVKQNKIQDTLYPPDHWKKFKNDKTIKQWLKLDSCKKVELVDVTEPEENTIKNLIEKTWKSSIVGKGKDSKMSGYKEMKIMDVQRIENPTVYEKYAENKQKLLLRVRKRNVRLKQLDEIPGCDAVETVKYIQENNKMFNDICTEVNEHYLFHGTTNNSIDLITEDGFDVRVAKNGLFGKATYAAECPTKSDQYSEQSYENCKMILLRMLLGDMFVAKEAYNFTRPPCKKCVEKKSQDLTECKVLSHHKNKNWNYDSVVGAIPHKLREFIVYDHAMCYPEYIITYNRV